VEKRRKRPKKEKGKGSPPLKKTKMKNKKKGEKVTLGEKKFCIYFRRKRTEARGGKRKRGIYSPGFTQEKAYLPKKKGKRK